MDTRYDWLDVAKVLGIYLMILGHQNLVSQQVGQWIYSFHMPLFFFLSGICFTKRSFTDQLKRVWTSLIVPFLIIASFWCLYYFVCYIKGGYDLKDLMPYIIGSFVSPGKDFLYFKPLCRPTWFLLSLAFIKIVFSINVIEYKRSFLFVTVLFAVLISFVLSRFDITLPFALDSALLGMPFFAIGILSKEEIAKDWKWMLPIAFVISFMVVLFLSSWNGIVDTNKLLYGGDMLAYYMCGMSGSIMIIAFSKIICMKSKIGKSKLIRTLSLGTIIMIGFSSHLSSSIRSIILAIIPSFGEVALGYIVGLLCLLSFYPITVLSSKWFPIILGKKKLS